REHVAGHRLEFLVADLDEREAALEQELPERHGQERRVDDREIAVDGAYQRHQVHDVALAAPMRQRYLDDVDAAAEQGAQLADALGVRAIPEPDDQRALVEPDDVAALEQPRRLDAPANLEAESGERPRLRGRLGLARALAHAAENEPA